MKRRFWIDNSWDKRGVVAVCFATHFSAGRCHPVEECSWKAALMSSSPQTQRKYSPLCSSSPESLLAFRCGWPIRYTSPVCVLALSWLCGDYLHVTPFFHSLLWGSLPCLINGYLTFCLATLNSAGTPHPHCHQPPSPFPSRVPLCLLLWRHPPWQRVMLRGRRDLCENSNQNQK